MRHKQSDERIEEHEEFLTVRQLAEVLQVSESTVRRLAHQRRIPSIRLTPRLLRFNLNAVREVLDSSYRNRPRRPGPEPPVDDAQLSFADLT